MRSPIFRPSSVGVARIAVTAGPASRSTTPTVKGTSTRSSRCRWTVAKEWRWPLAGKADRCQLVAQGAAFFASIILGREKSIAA